MDDTSDTIRLQDGRVLAFATYGDPAGTPLLLFHGIPSCRLMHPGEADCAELGVRLVVPDRPGFGRSDPQPGRTLLDWANDVRELTAALGIDRFAIAGASGGAPFVAATAWRLGPRITRAAIIAGSGPVDAPGAMAGMALERRLGYWLARRLPRLFRKVLELRGDPHGDPEGFFANYTRHNPPSDQAILALPKVREMFLRTYAEATRQGPDAFAWEVTLASRPWGFALEEIAAPLTLWHGDADNSTPLGMARAVAARIPDARLQVLPGEGHLIHFAHWRWILEDVLSESLASAPCEA